MFQRYHVDNKIFNMRCKREFMLAPKTSNVYYLAKFISCGLCSLDLKDDANELGEEHEK